MHLTLRVGPYLVHSYDRECDSETNPGALTRSKLCDHEMEGRTANEVFPCSPQISKITELLAPKMQANGSISSKGTAYRSQGGAVRMISCTQSRCRQVYKESQKDPETVKLRGRHCCVCHSLPSLRLHDRPGLPGFRFVCYPWSLVYAARNNIIGS